MMIVLSVLSKRLTYPFNNVMSTSKKSTLPVD